MGGRRRSEAGSQGGLLLYPPKRGGVLEVSNIVVSEPSNKEPGLVEKKGGVGWINTDPDS